MPQFPSVEWFEALRETVQDDPHWRDFGMMDCAMGVNVGETTIKLVFDGFEIPEIADISDSADDADLDFTLVMSPERWQEMIKNIQSNGHADLHHTLNTIDLESPEELAKGEDYNRRDLFYRFNQTLQDFFDASSSVETTFA
ncbi:MAG: hypothetical protein OXS30_00595 [Chloroflexota bacterium]|nr:hypothetical protein [Chloroflexota bacterium]MYE06461.1 hypothetical protein [Chloroflexota bacterium]